MTHRSSFRNSECWCSTVVVFDGDDRVPISVDIDVEPLSASRDGLSGVGADRCQCCVETDSTITVEILIEVGFMFGDAPQLEFDQSSTPALLIE